MNRGNTTKERMKKVLTALEVSADEFENKCGLPSGFVDDINREIPKKIRQKISTAYPRLNIEYIALGTGDIFTQESLTAETIKNRLRDFLSYMSMGRKEFGEKSGVSPALLSKMSENLRKKSLEKIYQAFPMLNPEWLVYGKGEMIIDRNEIDSNESTLERIGKLIDYIGITKHAFLFETNIASLNDNITKKTVDKIVNRYPFVNPLWIMHGTGEMCIGDISDICKI